MHPQLAISPRGISFHGRNEEFLYSRSHELMLSGPAETGKTITALSKLNLLCIKYGGAHALMVRKTQKSMHPSVIRSFQEKILADGAPVRPFGGQRPEWFDYPNGSRIVCAGMDNPAKILSAEYDFIYVNQAEELTLNDWETLTTRATGRAGHAPHAQVFGDCNPSGSRHWILERERAGALVRINSRHTDNPMLYDQESGDMTEQGRRSMAVLDALTGLRRDRLRDGKWVSAEGQVYAEWSEDVHLVDRFEVRRDWRRIRVIDFGFSHPFLCQWWAFDHDGRAYLYREIYMTRRTVRQHAQQINSLTQGEAIEATIADHDAEDRATLAEHGIATIAAKKTVQTGIDKVQDRLRIQDDGKPRLFIMRDSVVEVDPYLLDNHLPTCTADEIDGYVWSNKATKEVPVKQNDHGMDSIRYLCMHVDAGAPTAPPQVTGARAVVAIAPSPTGQRAARRLPPELGRR